MVETERGTDRHVEAEIDRKRQTNKRNKLSVCPLVIAAALVNA